MILNKPSVIDISFDYAESNLTTASSKAFTVFGAIPSSFSESPGLSVGHKGILTAFKSFHPW